MYAYNLVLAAVATDNLAVWKRNKLLSIWIITPAVQSELFTPMGLESRMKRAYNQKRIYSHNLGEILGAIPLTLRPRTLALKCFPLPVYLRRPHPGIAKYSETRINTSLLFQIPTWWCSQRRISWVASWWLLITAVLQICFLWLPDRLGRLGRGIYRVAEAREPRWNLVKFEDVCMYII